MFAIVCAHNPGRRNLGMYSVDLSAEQFFSGLGAPFELLKYTGHTEIGDIRYRKIRNANDLREFHRIVFWGDFQQNPIWGRDNFGRRIARERGGSHPEGFELWKDLCLLRGQDDADANRAYSIGTCFLGADDALKGHPFADEYVHLLSRFGAIVPRDDRSVAILTALGLSNVIPGFDCASLAEHGMAAASRKNRFCYSFGRTLRGLGTRPLVRRLEEKFGLTGQPIDWLLGKYRLSGISSCYRRAVERIADCRFVVTDIYHLSINCMNLGRNVYCVGDEDQTFTDVCDDYKKQILMRMSGAAERYLAIPEDTRDKAEFVTDRIAEMIREDEVSAPPIFRERSERFRSTLRSMMTST